MQKPVVISPHPAIINPQPTVINSQPIIPHQIIQAPVAKLITFTREMINDQTVVELAQGLDMANYQNLLKFISDHYYNQISLISDTNFDLILGIYQSKYGPYNIVGAEPTGEKADLPYYLGSLRKIKEKHELTNWLQKFPGPYVTEDKIDGLTLLLVNNLNPQGKPVINLYTRGGGYRGTDVSHLAPYLSLPVINENIAVRGEIVMTKSSWSRVREDHKNPRNLASGIVNAKKHFDPRLAQELTFYSYKILSQNMTPVEEISKLKKLGFNLPSLVLSQTLTYQMLAIRLKQRIIEAPYEIDGLVIYQNLAIEYPAGKDPYHVIAFKMSTESAITTVLDVVWDASRNRLLKPVIHYQPISLSGATLQKASGYNARYIVTNKNGPRATIKVTEEAK